MCDYSLGEVRSRLAVEGEELIVHRFPTHTIGLASPSELRTGNSQPSTTTFWEKIKCLFAPSHAGSACAVCVPPGASLILKNIPEDLQRQFGIRCEEPVMFVQTSLEAYVHRDALRFRSGLQLLLQKLSEGIRVTVLSLGDEQTPSIPNTRDALQPVRTPAVRFD